MGRTLLLIACFVVSATFLIPSTEAIYCYQCFGYADVCGATTPGVNCGSGRLCRLAQDPNTGRVEQGCADSEDCPRGDFQGRIDAKIEVACCSSNYCNCIGTQCGSDIPISGSRIQPAASIAALFALIAFIF